jgi:hypothetical protein
LIRSAVASAIVGEDSMLCASVRASEAFEGGSYLFRFKESWRGLLVAVAFLIVLTPGIAGACACGCGVFDVGTPSLLPSGDGGTLWYDFDFMNQYIDWHSSQPAARAGNDDKQIKSYFQTVGAQYMFNHKFGLMVTVPYTARVFRTVGNGGEINQFEHGNFGDVRVWGMYTGLQEDMSLGLLAGLKLPTGDYEYPKFDRDTSIGTGSTDLLLSAYKQGVIPSKLGNLNLTVMERPFNWYLQGQFEYPFLSKDRYVPGKEFDGALGTYYNFGQVGPLSEVAPILSFLASVRARDQGSEADPTCSGYQRVLIAPGTELGWGPFRLYGDVEVPVFQFVNGHQLTTPYLIKTILSYSF